MSKLLDKINRFAKFHSFTSWITSLAHAKKPIPNFFFLDKIFIYYLISKMFATYVMTNLMLNIGKKIFCFNII